MTWKRYRNKAAEQKTHSEVTGSKGLPCSARDAPATPGSAPRARAGGLVSARNPPARLASEPRGARVCGARTDSLCAAAGKALPCAARHPEPGAGRPRLRALTVSPTGSHASAWATSARGLRGRGRKPDCTLGAEEARGQAARTARESGVSAEQGGHGAGLGGWCPGRPRGPRSSRERRPRGQAACERLRGAGSEAHSAGRACQLHPPCRGLSSPARGATHLACGRVHPRLLGFGARDPGGAQARLPPGRQASWAGGEARRARCTGAGGGGNLRAAPASARETGEPAGRAGRRGCRAGA